MTWFKVDDGLHKHRKRIRTGISVEGFAAIGLWTIAGSWSSDELSDGWIADEVLEYLAPGFGELLASRLQHAGLWHREERDGEKGWQFHQWDERQPMAEQVLAERAESAERQRRARERAKAARNAVSTPGEVPEVSQRESQRDAGRTHTDVTGAVTVPPTRPDPTRPELPPEVLFGAAPERDDDAMDEEVAQSGQQQRASRLPANFAVTPAMVAWAKRRTPDVDIGRELVKFRNYWLAKSGKEAAKVNWVRTWQNWMLKAAEGTARASPNGRRYGTPGAGSDYANYADPVAAFPEEIPE